MDYIYNWLHLYWVNLRSALTNSTFISLLNLILATVAFVSFVVPKFSNWGFKIVPIVVLLFIVTVVFFVRDLWRRETRARAILTFWFCVPVLLFFGQLMQWEGPLDVAVASEAPLKFRIQGPAGFHGLEILDNGPRDADGRARLLWAIEWQHLREFPPMELEVDYGRLPEGFARKDNGNSIPASLSPTTTYAVIVRPAMGTIRCYSLRGSQIIEYKPYPKACFK